MERPPARKTLIACGLLGALLFLTRKFSLGDHTGSITLKPKIPPHAGCAYVSDHPELTDACALDADMPAANKDNVVRYFAQKHIPFARVHHFRFATTQLERAEPILFNCILSQPDLKLFTQGCKRTNWTFPQAQNAIGQGIYGEATLSTFPVNQLPWWPPADSSHIVTFVGRMAWGVDDVDPGQEYYVFAEEKSGALYGLVW